MHNVQIVISPDKTPVFLKSRDLNIWLYLSLAAGVIVFELLIVPCKVFPCVNDNCGWTLLVMIPGPLENPMFVVLVLKPPPPCRLNDDGAPNAFILVVAIPYDVADDIFGWFMPDQEIPEDGADDIFD